MFYARENVWHSRRRLTSAILRVSQQHKREAHYALLFCRPGYTTPPPTLPKKTADRFRTPHDNSHFGYNKNSGRDSRQRNRELGQRSYQFWSMPLVPPRDQCAIGQCTAT